MVAGHSLSGAAAAPAAVHTACAAWKRAAAWVSGPGAGVLGHAAAHCWKPGERGAVAAGCVHPVAYQFRTCPSAAVVSGRSGRQPLRVRGLTAGRKFQAWVARESLRRGGCLLGCLLGCRGLPPWNGRVVLPPESLRRPQDLAGQGVRLVSLAHGETEALGGLEHLPHAGLRRRDGCIRQVRLPQGGPPFQPERMPCRGRLEQESGPLPAPPRP